MYFFQQPNQIETFNYCPIGLVPAQVNTPHIDMRSRPLVFIAMPLDISHKYNKNNVSLYTYVYPPYLPFFIELLSKY